jgi:hypothetical protein
VQPGNVRPIEYEIVPRNDADKVSRSMAAIITKTLGVVSEVAVLRCVDDKGEKLTAVGDADHFRKLLENGTARNPDGISLTTRKFPLVLLGWQRYSVS